MKFSKPFLFLTMFASLAVHAQSGMGSSPSSTSPSALGTSSSPSSYGTSDNINPSTNNSGTSRTNSRGTSNQQRMEDSRHSPSTTTPGAGAAPSNTTTPAGVSSPAMGTGTP